MNFWQIFIIGWYMMSLGMVLAKNGQPKKGTYSFWWSVADIAAIFFALYKGGFWS